MKILELQGVTSGDLNAYTLAALEEFLKAVAGLDEIQFRIHEESGLKRTLTMGSGLLTAPFRMGFGLLIATAAPGEWESMRRRSEFALRPPDEFSRGQWNDFYSPASGAVGILLSAALRCAGVDDDLVGGDAGHGSGALGDHHRS